MRRARENFLSVAIARFLLLLAAGVSLSVSGVTENHGEPRSVIYSDWEGQTADWQDSVDTAAKRVGSFTVGKPRTEKFVGGLFDEWRDLILPEFGRFDPLARQRVRDKLFFNRDGGDFHEYLRGRREDLLLRLNRVSADYLTGTLTRGVETGAGGLSFVRTVEVDYQSSLGKRRWQSGVNVLGALRETADDAIVWQLRGYAAKESSGGANVGLIYRRALGEEALVGANVFFDYEEHDYGSFSRWSLGGEVRGGWGGLFANRYMVLSDAKVLKDGQIAYSRDGFDVAAEFKVPKFRWISGGLTHYKWDGEHGDADDKGFRYHAAFDFSEPMGGGDFWGGLSFEVEYDHPERGGGDWGGRISYRHQFGAPTPTGSSTAAESFDPRAHFFDPVRREYAQRISKTKPAESLVTATVVGSLAVTVAGRAILDFDTGETTVTLTARGPDFVYKREAAVAARAVAVTTTMQLDRKDFALQVGHSSWTVQLFAQSTMEFLSEGRRLHLQRGTLYILHDSEIREITTPTLTINLYEEVETKMTVIHPIVRDEDTTVSVTRIDISTGIITISVNDKIDDVVTVNISDDATVVIINPTLTVTVGGIVDYSGQTIFVPFGHTGIVTTALSVRGGDPSSYRYSVLTAMSLYTFVNGLLSVSDSHSVTVVSSVTVEVGDDYSRPVTATVVLSPVSRLAVFPDPLVATSFRTDTEVGTPLLTLSVSGGTRKYQYTISDRDRFSVGGVSVSVVVISLASRAENEEVRVVAVTVGDDLTDRPEFEEWRRLWTVSFYEGIGFSPPSGSRAVAAHYDGVVYTVMASGGEGATVYSSEVPKVSVASDGGVSLMTPLNGSDLVVTVTAEDQDPGNSDMAFFVLTLVNVDTFNPPAVPLLYAEAGENPGRRLDGALSGGAVYGEMADDDNRVSVDAASGAIYLQTALPSPGTTTVVLFAGRTDALGNGRRPVTVTLSFYDRIGLPPSPVDVPVPADVGGEYYTVVASGGSGSYNYSVVSGDVVLRNSGVSVAGVAADVTLTAVVEVQDAVIAINPAARLTLRFIGKAGLSFGSFRRSHYVPTSRSRQVLVTLNAINGTPAYVFSESHPHFEIESGNVLVFVNPSRSTAAYSVALVVTDSDSPPARATTRVAVTVYEPLRVAPTAVTHTVSSMRTGAVHTVSASLGSGNYGYSAGTAPVNHVVRMAGNVLALDEDLSSLAGGLLTVRIRVSETGAGYGGESVTQAVALLGVPPLSLAPFALSPVRPDAPAGHLLLTLSVSGGLSPYRYAIAGGGLSVDSSAGIIALATAGSEGEVREATVVIRDETSFNELSVPLTVSFRVDSGVSGETLTVERVPVQRVAVTASAPFSLLSLTATGGERPYRWSRLSVVSEVLSVSPDGGVGVTALLPARMTATVSVAVTDVRNRSGTGVLTVAFYRLLDAASSYSLTMTVSADHTGLLLTATVPDGTGEFEYDLSPHPASVSATVDPLGLVSLHSPLGLLPGATLTIEFSDRLDDGMATLFLILVRHLDPLSFSPSSAEYLVSPDYTGVVHVLQAAGGFGDYRYERVSGTTALQTDPSSGAISLVSTLPVGSAETAVFAAQDAVGGSARFSLILRVTAVAAREGAMYLIGGSGGLTKVQNDIWQSTDGAVWTRVVASVDFSSRNNHQAVSHGGTLWVVGGIGSSGGSDSDIWYSPDGLVWTRVASTTGFSDRFEHQMVSHDGSLWVAAGSPTSGNRFNDIWLSADGFDWTGVTDSAAFSGRGRHQLVSYGGSLWLSGGFDGSQGLNDLWRSANGLDWTRVSPVSVFSGRYEHQMVSHGGTLWVIGGVVDRAGVATPSDEVWRSADGVSWVKVSSAATLPPRAEHQAVSFGGSLWVIGGFGPDGSGSLNERKNDVWRSADGVSWIRVVSSAAFSARQSHQVVVFRPTFTSYEVSEIRVTPPGVQTVLIRGALPRILTTLSATGGVDELRYDLVSDDRGVLRPDADGVLIATSFLGSGEFATVTVRVRDLTPVNSAMVAVTLFYVDVAPLSFVPDSAEYVVSPDFTGFVHSLTATDGFGDYTYEKVSGNSVLTLDAGTGAISLVSTLPAGSAETAVFAAKDGIGGSARFSLILQADTATAGEEAMYLIGGSGSKKNAK